MGETNFLPGDVVTFDGGTWQIVGIGPARTSERLRYAMRSGTTTIFRYVDQFDERDDVSLVIDDDETAAIVAAIDDTDPELDVDPELDSEVGLFADDDPED